VTERTADHEPAGGSSFTAAFAPEHLLPEHQCEQRHGDHAHDLANHPLVHVTAIATLHDTAILSTSAIAAFYGA